ncbi:ABC transporter ATP-binding protein [Comamonas thiooxydans]|uniref:ABC transporter ATP-binding protein n=1 Tax=Comamonas thiooxydans TaxID=363952 RepID=UPI0005556F90|nr:ABC transporter ATP-binding protein [Comamonas thiooxydans]
MTNFLSVNGLQASYGRAQALFDISFNMAQGEVITLLGRNGMGRSTTVKCLFGMMKPKAGSIEVGGMRTESFPSHRIARQGLALVPEGRQVFPNLTVEENLIATARDENRGQAKRWNLASVYAFFPRLQERRGNLGSQLSGGEQQMLAIGRALMTNPSLLVLDEATEGLAPVIRLEIWAALAQLKAEGMSQIIIDKNLRSLLDLADRHYVIEKGRVVWQGNSQGLRDQPAIVHQYLGL